MRRSRVHSAGVNRCRVRKDEANPEFQPRTRVSFRGARARHKSSSMIYPAALPDLVLGFRQGCAGRDTKWGLQDIRFDRYRGVLGGSRA